MSTIFSKIVDGSIPCYKVAEDDHFLAFLDISPLAEGHVLVIPKQETDYIFDINDETFMAFWLFAKRVAKALKMAIPCIKVGVAVVGLEVPHAHIHLVPLHQVSDLNFSRPKLTLPAERMKEIADVISSRFK